MGWTVKKSVEVWQLVGFAVTTIGGTILHFLYDWTGGAVWIAPFSGVNESTWEHMKLLFWPTFLFAVVESFAFAHRKDFWCAKLQGTLLGLASIPVLFYTYNGVVGKSPDWVNIAIFFVASAICYTWETFRFYKQNNKCKHPKIAFATLAIIAVLFVVFTFATPHLAIFQDPISGNFGI